MSDTTLETQLARHRAIDASPQHVIHIVLQQRVDTWKDEETGNYIALLPERITQGRTEAEAVESAKSLILMQAEWSKVQP